MHRMKVAAPAETRRRLRIEMDLHNPRRRDYALLSAEAARRYAVPARDGLFTRLMMWMFVRAISRRFA